MSFSNRAGVKQRINVVLITRSSLSNDQNITLSLIIWLYTTGSQKVPGNVV